MIPKFRFSSKVSVLLGFLAILVSVGTSPSSAQAAETFSVDSANGGMALNTNNLFRKIDGQPRMSLWQRNDQDPDQQFDRLPGNRGGILLKHRSTGKCMNAYRRYNGAEFNVWPCDANDPDQNFNVVDLGGGYNLIQRTGTNLCVDSPTRDNGGKVHLWTCDRNNSNQRWKSSISPPVISGQINLPFRSGQTWYACQGYQGTVSHQTSFALDLTMTNRDFGGSACWAGDGNVNKSAGQAVFAPSAGKVIYVGADLICLQLDNNRSMLIGHINRRVPNGVQVGKDSLLGTVSSAAPVNGGYAHIHVEGRRSSGCQPGTSVPLTAANGFQFVGVGDLPDLPGGNDYFRRALTRL